MPLYLSNSYLALGSAFSQKCLPSPVVEPELVLWNKLLASSLNIDLSQCDNDELAEYFSGNRLFESSQPIVQAYAGHQFGHFNPQLGDGRAHLLGDIADEKNQRWDIQLKGSGASAFSRQGDGRCALGPALREYIMSEAMHALGVPTTRCLAVVSTGQAVYREKELPGAIVTRVASSHIRVGTFQFFAARQDHDSLKTLTRYAIERHYSEISLGSTLTTENVLAFFEAVLDKQVALITSWLKVGFIHGVMNTDNTAISGETIDYGPCAMMNNYNSSTVFSSIDKNARYAFGNQSKIMQWNMARLADCLLLIIDEDEELALTKISPLLQQFANDLQYRYFEMMVSKLGLTELVEGDVKLVNDLLSIMQEKQLDYTQFFVTLTNNLTSEAVNNVLTDESAEQDEWAQWLKRWYNRIDDVDEAKSVMQKNNPLVIPRNKDVEAVLLSTQETGDLTLLHRFIEVLQQPFTELSHTHHYQKAPHDGDKNYYTFCGT